MRCEEARAEYLEGTASETALGHLATCPQCRAHRPALDAMQRTLGDPLLWVVEPPAELEERVMGLVTGTAATEAPPKRGRRSWRRGAAVAAAVVVTALTAGALLLNRQAAPDWEITAPGTGPAAATSAVIAGWNTPGGTRVVLRADDLPSAPEGFTYELWFIGSAPISGGTFAVADEPVELFVGVARRDYPRVAVTLEPLDGDPAPSAVFVFDHQA